MTLDLSVGQETYATALPKNLIAWHSRDSGGALTGVTTTETGFIRIDGIPIRNGYHYEFVAPQVNITTSATGIIGIVQLRYSLSGNATTSSSRVTYGGFFRNSQPTDAANTNVGVMIGEYHASADGTLSVLMSVVRNTSSTGSVGLFASAANPCSLFVYEAGLFPATSGVDL